MSKITESANGEECSIRLPAFCNGRPDTVVWAHANGVRFGKGIGIKSPDILGAYACYACHMIFDGQHKRPKGMTRDEVELAFWRGHAESLVRLISKGIVK
jgi:hypothetical protein